METKKSVKAAYSTPHFERFGNVRDLTESAGKNNPAGTDSGTNGKDLVAFHRTH